MIKTGLLPLLLFFAGTVKSDQNALSFPYSLYPSDLRILEFKSMCPFESNKIDICQLKYRECFGQMNQLADCNAEFCRCLNKDRDEESSEEFVEVSSCTNHSDNACLRIHQNGKAFKKTILQAIKGPIVARTQERLERFNEDLDSMAKTCKITTKLSKATDSLKTKLNSSNELLEYVIKLLALPEMESSMLKNLQGCQAAMKKFERTLEYVDERSAKHLNLPYEFSYIGSEFGAPMKAAMRIMGDEACDKATLDFNHHAVVWVNCYDQQNPKEECDQKYFKGMNKILSTMDSKKAACGMFVDVIKTISPLRSDHFYREAASYHVESTQMRLRGKLDQGFERFLNGSITGRDTKNTIINLDASEKTSRRVVDNYDDINMKCVGTRRSAGIVSYCGYLYGYCMLIIKSECQVQFSICLSNIDNMDSACQSAINKTSHLLWVSQTALRTTTTRAPVQVGQSRSYESYWSTASSALLKMFMSLIGVALVLVIMVLVTWYLCRNPQHGKELESNNSNQSTSYCRPRMDKEDKVPFIEMNKSLETVSTDTTAESQSIHGSMDHDGLPVLESEVTKNNNQEEDKLSMKFDIHPNNEPSNQTNN